MNTRRNKRQTENDSEPTIGRQPIDSTETANVVINHEEQYGVFDQSSPTVNRDAFDAVIEKSSPKFDGDRADGVMDKSSPKGLDTADGDDPDGHLIVTMENLADEVADRSAPVDGEGWIEVSLDQVAQSADPIDPAAGTADDWIIIQSDSAVEPVAAIEPPPESMPVDVEVAAFDMAGADFVDDLVDG